MWNILGRVVNHTERPSLPRVVEALKQQYGVKELFCGDDAVVDLIFIHGLNGDRERSWTADNGVMWTRDLLPEKVPQARILTYGYNAYTEGDMRLANLFLHEHAESFIASLVLFRQQTSTEKRPIIFIAHSLGGILLKSALLHANKSHSGHLPQNLDIIKSTHGILYMGTPHQGAPGAELGQLVLNVKAIYTNVTTNSFLMQHLQADSESLQLQLKDYRSISHLFETKFFYEMYKTRILGPVAEQMIVPRYSAVVPGQVNVEAIGVAKDHIDLVKYMSDDDNDYQIVSSHLALMVRDIKKKATASPFQARVTRSANQIVTPSSSTQVIPTHTGPITTGRYVISNVHSGKLAALLSGKDQSDIVSVVRGFEGSNPGDQWDVAYRGTGVAPLVGTGVPRIYTVQNHKYALYASWDGQPKKGGKLCGKDSHRAWYIKETDKKGRYIISPTTNETLFWGHPDEESEHGSPLTLREWGITKNNQWMFERVDDSAE